MSELMVVLTRLVVDVNYVPPFEAVVALQDDATIAHAWTTCDDVQIRVWAALFARPDQQPAYARAVFERLAPRPRAPAMHAWIARVRADVGHRVPDVEPPPEVHDTAAGFLLYWLTGHATDIIDLATATSELRSIDGGKRVHAFIRKQLSPPTAAEVAPYIARYLGRTL